MPVCQHLRKEVLQNILFYFTDGFDVSLNVCVTICCALQPSFTNYFNTGFIVLSELQFFRQCWLLLDYSRARSWPRAPAFSSKWADTGSLSYFVVRSILRLVKTATSAQLGDYKLFAGPTLQHEIITLQLRFIAAIIGFPRR